MGSMWVGVEDAQADSVYTQNGWQARQVETSFALGQGFKSAFETGLGGQIVRGLQRDFTDPVKPWWIDRGADRIVTADLNERYGIEGRLNFKHAMSERAAAQLYQLKLREAAADQTMERANLGFGARLGVSLAAGLVDPANIALSFTPIPWLSRAQALEQGLSGAARIGARVGLGAAEGAFGAIAVEPLVYSLNREEGNDYTFQDSLINVFVGAGAGMVFRPLFLGLTEGKGAGHAPDIEDIASAGLTDTGNLLDLRTIDRNQLPEDFAARVPALENVPAADAVPPIVKEASPGTRLEAMAKAIEDVAEGRDVEVGSLFDAHKKGELADLRENANRNQIEFRAIKPAEAISPNNSKLPVTYALVELDDIVASHTAEGALNPDYPPALQPRDRSQSTSQLQINEIAQKLNPERLGETFDATTGAPIIGSDGAVESGNGRILALQRAFAENGPQAADYRSFLEGQGYPVDGMNNPILVRVADAARDPQERVNFAKDANAKQVGTYNAVEQAVQDSQQITLEDLSFHKGGDTTKVENAEFARRALAKVATAADMAELINSKTGRLSQKGEDRLRGALVQIAYGDAQINHDLFTRTDDIMKGIGVALSDIAPQWAQMRAAAAAGQIAAGVDGTENLVSALNLTRRARETGQPLGLYIQNLDMFEELAPATEAYLKIMFGPDLKRQVSAGRIKQALEKIVEQSMLADPSPGLFGDAPDVRPEDLARLALGEVERSAPLPEAAAAANGGGDAIPSGQRGDGGGTPSVSEGSPSPGSRQSKGIANVLAGHDDPELARLQSEAAEIDSFIDAMAEQGLEPAEADALRAVGPNLENENLRADALRAAQLCLLSTGG
jgi:hypothetical protein